VNPSIKIEERKREREREREGGREGGKERCTFNLLGMR
jgi:hypothetical protein